MKEWVDFFSQKSAQHAWRRHLTRLAIMRVWWSLILPWSRHRQWFAIIGLVEPNSVAQVGWMYLLLAKDEFCHTCRSLVPFGMNREQGLCTQHDDLQNSYQRL